MSEFLDTLKQRWVEAHQRYKEAQEALAAATARHTAAVAENNSWQKAFEMEKAREDQAAATAAAAIALANAGTSVTADVQVAPAVSESPAAAASEPATTTDVGKSDGNKTDMIRDLLRQHPGMTPSDLWDAAKGEISSRPYVYSILKRLKDREQVAVRRGKYYLRIPSKPEEAKPQVTVQ